MRLPCTHADRCVALQGNDATFHPFERLFVGDSRDSAADR